MSDSRNPLIFDGHNDALLHAHLPERGEGRTLLTESQQGHVDVPRALRGRLGGGFFSVFVPPLRVVADSWDADVTYTDTGYEVRLAPALDAEYAKAFSEELTGNLFELEAVSNGRVRVLFDVEDLKACLREGALGAVLHYEGAEAIDEDLGNLTGLYARGLRSLGIVWSRPNLFGHGVPFQFPSSPNIGPGLTEAGRSLVRACNELGILVDLAHLNERGFWNTAEISRAPLVSTHTAAHALCASTRNLTDRQLDAVGDSGGVVGVIFACGFIRADGRDDTDTPLSDIVRHIDYIAERIGIDCVALGSDFDGAKIPNTLGGASGLPKLIETLRAHGYDESSIRKIAHENWIRVLDRTWR